VTKNETSRRNAGNDCRPGRIQFGNRREADVVNGDALRSWIGRRRASAAVDETERLDRVCAETDRDISVSRGRAGIAVVRYSVYDLIDAASGYAHRAPCANRGDGRSNQSYAIDGKRLDGAEFILESATGKIDIEDCEGDVDSSRPQ
jgi:hypothetical protein